MSPQLMRERCRPFFDWVCQYPLMQQRVEMVSQRMMALTGVSGLTACMEMRDCFHTLFVYANEGDFEDIAAIFYQCYVQYCRLLLAYVS